MGRTGTTTPRRVRRTISMPSTEMEISVEGVGDEEAGVLLTGATGPTIDANLSFVAKTLSVPNVATERVVSPTVIELDAPEVIVYGELKLHDGSHALVIPYPTEADTVLSFDGFKLEWRKPGRRRKPLTK